MKKQSGLISSLSKVSLFLRQTPLSRWKALLKLQGFLISKLYRQNTVKVGDFIFRVHGGGEFIARKLILFGGYEKEEISLLCSLIKPGDTVIYIVLEKAV